MPSTNKTSLLGLNQWLGTDKPKREDFNQDNLNIENKVKEHHNNAVAHITAAERAAWNQSIFSTGTYTGNGTASRAISLGFRPRVLFLFCVGQPLGDYAGGYDTTNIFSAVCTPDGCSYGLALSDTGFSVRNNSSTVGSGNTLALNQNGKVYSYLAFR